MKPSEQIEKIANEKRVQSIDPNFYRAPEIHDWVNAVIEYLDEEYEKNKPCEHEPGGEMLSNGAYYCKKCRVMYYL